MIWHCPCMQTERQQLIDDFAPGLNIDALHPALKHGIAPAMSPHHNLTFWGAHVDQENDITKTTLGARRSIVTHTAHRAITTYLNDDDVDIINSLTDHGGEHDDHHDVPPDTAAKVMAHIKHLNGDYKQAKLP